MFSKELENLIQATLEDGVLEDHEKAALIKRAEREGVDIAELEIYINSLLQKRARELENEKNAVRKQAEKEKKEAFGRKCPNCGAQVPPLALKCECGYEFTKKEAVSSVQILSDKIEEILSNNTEDRYQRVRDAINMFPVPNTKEDIIEFLSLSVTNAKKRGGIWGTRVGRIAIVLLVIVIIEVIVWGFISISTLGEYDREGVMMIGICIGIALSLIIPLLISTSEDSTFIHNESVSVWRAKFNQVLMKGRSLRGDAEFTRQLDYYENMLNK